MAMAWDRIEAWLQKNAPAIARDLRNGASPQTIAAAERDLNVTLPESVKASYGRHDGSEGNAGPLMGEWKLMPLADVLQEWRTLKELLDDGTFEGTEAEADPGVRAEWWNPRWIPIAHNSAGDFRCVDMAPAPRGNEGQIMTFWHADPRRERIAPDIDAWLTAFADALERGKYTVQNDRLKETGSSR